MERCREVRRACQSIERSKRYQKEEWRCFFTPAYSGKEGKNGSEEVKLRS